MKYAALILFFTFSRLISQVGPPKLRCLEVLPDGSVRLSWTPATDPGNTFLYYEIFYSPVSKSGPYTPISPTVAPVSTASAIHTATTALAQSSYYFVRSVRTNSTVSSHSDTLRTIFLNVFVGNPALELNYNNIRVPTLQGSSSTFTITKEYPLGTVNNLTVTPHSSHDDVISVCKEKINYQVLLSDNSGCVSKSNTIFGEYEDTKDPDTTFIDSISVLLDGRTILAWRPVFDNDVDTYLVIKKLPASNVYIDSLSGRMTNSYIYDSTEARLKPVSLFVSAVDSCNKTGPFDQRPTTMFLQTAYDHCAYRTRLIWNNYQGMRKGIKEYRVYYSKEGGDFIRLGSTTENTFTHDSVEPGNNVCYFVRVVNGDESITASSNRNCFFTSEVNIPTFFYMSSASVNRQQDVNVNILVDKQERFASIDLQRYSQVNQIYETIATAPFSGNEQYTFTDTDAETAERSYYYKAVLRDSCGNARSVSNICRTILLRVSSDTDDIFARTLTWSPYIGFAGGVKGYNIYRIVNNDLAPPVIAQTGPGETTYTDNLEEIAARGAEIAYYVQALEAPGSPFPVTDISNSNIQQVYVEGRIFVPNAFAPGGINKTWKPVTHFVDKKEYVLRVFNRWGQQVFETNDDGAAWDGQGCSPGVYVYLISYRNARGEYKEQKGTVVML